MAQRLTDKAEATPALDVAAFREDGRRRLAKAECHDRAESLLMFRALLSGHKATAFSDESLARILDAASKVPWPG